MTQERFPQEVIDQLKHYVYCLVDPRDDKIFYIGKGVGNRVFEHAEGALRKDADPTEKNETIQQIIQNDLEVKYYIIRHNLTEEEAFLVESVLIDFLTYDNFNQRKTLTNIQGGHKQREFGIASVEEIIDRFGTGRKGDYLYNGTDYKKKTDLVQAVVHDYIDTHDVTTIEELKKVFDLRLKQGAPMVLSLEDALKTKDSAGEAGGNFAIAENMQIDMKKKGLLGIKTGVKVVVWKYWTERFFIGFLDLAKRLGYKIEEK